MTRLFVKLAMVAIVGGVLWSSPTVAQMHPPAMLPPAKKGEILPPAKKGEILPPAKKAEHVKIIKAPTLEIAVDDLAIVRWTTTNPGGSDEHFGVVHYGTDASNLWQIAQSHIRLNRNHPDTIFRVRIPGVKPETTYYYWVTSIESNGRGDGVKSSVYHFTTPAPGKRIVVANP